MGEADTGDGAVCLGSRKIIHIFHVMVLLIQFTLCLVISSSGSSCGVVLQPISAASDQPGACRRIHIGDIFFYIAVKEQDAAQ